eukprot:TRINITY_DN920_c0_g1_i1.p6 TRINITY_DN920_c0_g1~~TRINITY_DN920_c0_g1_i1.p6  ORF type:complete len:224 (+),score=6.17 TRINITY_DN920_c0_g1_i1:3523-4194(+)
MDFYLLTAFSANTVFDSLPIQANVTCSLRNYEIFKVKFLNPKLIQDLRNNSLCTPVLTARALRYVYISEAEKIAIEGTGSAFSVMSLITLGLAILIRLLKSAAMESFWDFVNMLQLLSFGPIISCVVPHNLEMFLTEYLEVCKVTFPFRLLPSWLPSPTDYLSSFLTVPFNERFLICGYEALSFIYNFAEELATWVLLLGFYILLKLLTCIFSKSSQNLTVQG